MEVRLVRIWYWFAVGLLLAWYWLAVGLRWFGLFAVGLLLV
tara:strand:- start:108 stop:230 length:123 start_codon:yes stop_codon:yes gene_type:complete